MDNRLSLFIVEPGEKPLEIIGTVNFPGPIDVIGAGYALILISLILVKKRFS